MNELALFAGAGGGILGGKLLGWRTVCAVEIEPYPISVLIQRQNEGILAPFPIWDDVSTFDGTPWRGLVDVVSGGFPCQDISAGNPNGKGLSGTRSGLWSEFARIINEVRSEFAFVENSPLLKTKGLDRVLSDLAEMGYDAEWGVFGGKDVGAPHLRERMWILAHNNSFGHCSASECKMRRSFLGQNRKTETQNLSWPLGKHGTCPPAAGGIWQHSDFNILGMVDGLADRLDRIKSIGNGQIPIVAATAWSILLKRLGEK